LDAQTLQAVQQPLKDTYRQDPQQAMITLTAQGELGAEDVSCSVATGRLNFDLDTDASAEELDTHPAPADSAVVLRRLPDRYLIHQFVCHGQSASPCGGAVPV
jgi:hypothetical protein